ncbi:hypothetical protein M9979_00795 [Sphingomonas sp. RP10(2022)]|uniref:Uncharacterized protein n=1 Tax=Sphingomonas liriopis TaxID=2949094 RepID=A0A9X2KP02_9SPHN|nr:hypothetical protein [Sphingomonas liriopis]MCP3733422.1 hypothetical protein [Sphingomonas liriopis]
MPVTKLNPLGVAGPRTIAPISSLSPGLEEAVAVTLPDTAVNANAVAVGAGRPQWAQYEMTAQGTGAQHVDLALLLADRHDAPAVVAPVADPADRGLVGAAVPSEGLWHDETPLHLDARPADSATVAPTELFAAPTSIVSALDAAPVVAVAAEAHAFAAVDLAAFRAADGAHLAPHELFVMPLHDMPPIDGTVPLLG